MRHQHWVVKIDYNDGQGTGNIFGNWAIREISRCRVGQTLRIGFTLNTMRMLSAPTAVGVLRLAACSTMGTIECLDSSGTICGARLPLLAPAVFQFCNWTKPPKPQPSNGSMTWRQRIPFFGGSARLLHNGNLSSTSARHGDRALPVVILEVTKTTPPQTVGRCEITGHNAYRGFAHPQPVSRRAMVDKLTADAGNRFRLIDMEHCSHYTRSAMAPSIRWKKNNPPSSNTSTPVADPSSTMLGACPCPVNAQRKPSITPVMGFNP